MDVFGVAISAAIVAATRPTLREITFAAAGFLMAHVLRRHHLLAKALRKRRRSAPICGSCEEDTQSVLRSEHVISDLDALRATIPSGLSGTCVDDAPKVIDHLDEQMVGFVRRSPFVQLATVDSAGQPFVSPKGDKPGFVEVVGEGVALRIPDRPGNRLVFGLQNALQGSRRVGLCFVIPGNETTLRVGGQVTLSRDPELLKRHAARGLEPKLLLHIEIGHAFFHCAKAYLRSQMWKPESWPAEVYRVRFGPYFHSSKLMGEALDASVDQHYGEVARAVRGERAEPD